MKSVYRRSVVYFLVFIYVFLAKSIYVSAASDIDYHNMDYEEISSQIAKDVADYHVP